MAIRVQWDDDGPFAICDTTAEAIELLRQARASQHNGTHKTKPEVAVVPRRAEERVDAFLAATNDKGKLLLKSLVDYPTGVEGEEFNKVLGIDSAGLGGIMGSLSKAAKKARFSIDQFVTSEARFEGARRYRWMAPTKLLMDHMEQVQ